MAEAVRVKSKKKGRSKAREKVVKISHIDEEEEIIEEKKSTVFKDEGKPEEGLLCDEIIRNGVPEIPVPNDQHLHEVVSDAHDKNVVEKNDGENEPSETPLKTIVENAVNHSVYHQNVQESSIPNGSSLYRDLEKLLIEVPDVATEVPSAPTPILSNGIENVNVDLPRDRKAAEIAFPQSFEENFSQVVKEQQQLSLLKPFTSEQLVSFYENTLLAGEEVIVESFLECRKNLENHPLYDSLTSFLRSRLALKNATDELEQLNRDVDALASQLWTIETRRATEYGECSDSKRVKAQHDFPVAHLNDKSSAQLVRLLQQQREKIQEKLVLSVYESHWWKQRIDCFISQGSQHSEHGSISVLFAFLRRPVRDEIFVDHVKVWLNFVAMSLLKRARKEDYLFLAHHVLRCPVGLASWASPYIQTPYYDPFESASDINVHHVDVALALLSILCQPVRARQEFLLTWVDPDEDNHWVWLDSEGEDENGEQATVMNLNDDDLLSLLNQIPLGNIFRFLFHLRQQDQVDAYTGSLQAGQWLRTFAVCRHLLKMFESGLTTYQGPRYKTLAKKFGQLILHTISNVSDFWLLQHSRQQSVDRSMFDRILREYEHVMLEGMTLLIRTRQQRSWQLLSRIPLAGLTPRLRFDLWLRWHSEITGEPIEVESIRADSFWGLLGSKLIQLPEPDWFVFLVTLAAMASEGSASSDDHFLQLVAWELTELGLLSDTTREICFKTTKDLLANIIERYPPFVSFILERLKQHQVLPSATLVFFKDLPLLRWQPIDQDFQLLRNWLINDTLDSVSHQLAVTILTRLNWALEDGPKRPFLGVGFHQKTALMLVEVVSIHSRLPVPSAVPVLASNFLADSVQFLSSFSRSWNSSSLVQWAWHLVLKLRLHAFDSYPDHLIWMLHHPQRAFCTVRLWQDDPELSILRQTPPTPFSCFVSLSMTSVGHSVPEFCSIGLDLLFILSSADQHCPVVTILHHLFPLLATCPDVLYDQTRLLDVFQRLIQADSSYYKRAKSLLVSQFPGIVLKMVASLMESTVRNLVGLNLTGTPHPVEIWLNLLTTLPKWNADKSVLYLLDVLARIAHLDSISFASFKRILSVVLQESNKVYRPSKGFVSRVGNWVSGSSEALGHLDATELIPPNSSIPYLSWIVLELELERQSKLWQHLMVDLQPGRAKSIDQALKSITGVLKIQSVSVNQLCLVRFAQMAVDMELDHPLIPVFVQRFFTLYFSRTEATEIGVDSWAVGQRIMTSSTALSSLLKRLVLSWEDGVKRFESEPVRSGFFQSCCLWIEDVKLLEPHIYLPTLAPNYSPTRLLQVFQGSDSLWLDVYDVSAIFAEQQELREYLNKERHITHLDASRKSAPAFLSNTETIFSRLQSYPDPVRLTDVPLKIPFYRLPLQTFQRAGDLRQQLESHLKVVIDSADQFCRRMAELTSLDCHYSELLSELYKAHRVERTATVKCNGTQSGACSGSAVIRISCNAWRIDSSVRKQSDTNRQEASRIRSTFQDPNVGRLCLAALLLEDCMEQIRVSSEPNVLETGAALFYILVELVNEETNNYLPTKQLLSTCLEGLGQRCIAGHPEQCRNLVGLLGSNANLAGLVAPHFTPSTSEPSSSAIDAFLDSYRLVTALSKHDSDLILVLLTKFDVRWWLNCPQCWPQDRSKLLDIIFAALDSYGPQPAEKALAVHEVLRRHLQLVLSFKFPEQYTRVLESLLKSSEAQTCSPVVWCDLINTLGQGWLRFQPDSTMEEFRQQVLQYTTQQTLLDVNRMMETAVLLSQHFSRERQLHGFYGLYPKYRPYVHVASCFLLTIGHGLCFATLQIDAGSPSDLLVGQLWGTIRDLYSPWILPYTQQQVSSNCAAWIQQLSSDRKLLLPWIAADSGLALLMATSITHCVSFLNETLPAQQSILSHLLTFYLHGFCHTAVKPHILQVIHQALETLPWQTFVPSLTDLEQLVRTTGQFLPEVHSFLVSLFIRCSLSSLVAQWRSQPASCPRLLSCLLHLHVRLAGEPTAQQNPMMKRILEEACFYPWHYVDASVYDQVLNWYISTSDPLFILQPYLERQETMSSSNDPLVFRLLQVASGYGMQPSDQIESSLKRQMFIRSWIRLVTLTVSRHRSLIQHHPKAIPNAIGSLLEFICKNSHPADYGRPDSAVHEYLMAVVSSSPIADTLQTCLCQRMSSYSNPDLVQTVLRVVVTLHGDLKRMAAVMESALEQFDGTRSFLFGLLPKAGSKELASVCWQQGCLLSWYCLVSNQDSTSPEDVVFVLEQLLSNCKSLVLSEEMEPKLCLLYERLVTILSLATDFSTQKTALRSEWCSLLNSWSEDNSSWFSSIGLGKTAKLSSKGRCLAQVMVCYLHPSAEALDQLEKWGAIRQNSDCKAAVELALTTLKRDNSDGLVLLQSMVPLLYSRTYLSRLLIPA